MPTAPTSPTPLPETTAAGGILHAQTNNAQQKANIAALWGNIAYLFGVDGVRSNAFNVLASSGGYVAGNLSVKLDLSVGGSIGAAGNVSAVGGMGAAFFTVNANQNGAVNIFERNNGSALWALYASSGAFRVWNNTGDKLSVDGSGVLAVAGNVVVSSDARLKRGVDQLRDMLPAILALRGVRYVRTDTERPGLGVIAQEVREVFPQAVHEDEEGMLSVDYQALIGPLIEAARELTERVARLENAVIPAQAGIQMDNP